MDLGLAPRWLGFWGHVSLGLAPRPFGVAPRGGARGASIGFGEALSAAARPRPAHRRGRPDASSCWIRSPRSACVIGRTRRPFDARERPRRPFRSTNADSKRPTTRSGDFMNAPEFSSRDLTIPAEFQARFDAQRGAFLKAPDPSHAERLADLRALARLLTENQRAIVAAVDADYGGRSEFETMFGEIFAFAGRPPRRAKASGALDAAAPAKRRCAPLSRRPQPPNPPTLRRSRRDRAVELSDLPELRAAHRRYCRGELGDGQDVGEF